MTMDQQDRLALEYLSRELATNETRIYEHITITFRWLMATLFTANGGATIALLSNGTQFRGELFALGAFATGIIFSLLMGILSAFMGHRVMSPLTNAKAKVHQGLITGNTTDAEEALKVLVQKQTMNWKLWSPTYSGLLSFACFVIGVVTIAAPLIR
jgi:hypothetical protein